MARVGFASARHEPFVPLAGGNMYSSVRLLLYDSPSIQLPNSKLLAGTYLVESRTASRLDSRRATGKLDTALK